jgi:hypothetical protein
VTPVRGDEVHAEALGHLAIGGPPVRRDSLPAERPITTRDLLTFTFGFGMALEMFTSREPWPVSDTRGEHG